MHDCQKLPSQSDPLCNPSSNHHHHLILPFGSCITTQLLKHAQLPKAPFPININQYKSTFKKKTIKQKKNNFFYFKYHIL